MGSSRNTKYLLFYCPILIFSFGILRKLYDEQMWNEEGRKEFTFKDLTEEQVKKKDESYSAQEKTVAIKNRLDDVLPIIVANNSQDLPIRYLNANPLDICHSNNSNCVPPFANFEPLIVTAPNYRMMSCINQKSLSTVMNAVFCFLIRSKVFMSEGRSLLREYSDIKLCQGRNEFSSIDEARKVLKIRKESLVDWKLTMVTRDPIDRFLSGFVDRCIRTGDSCFGCTSNMTCFMEKSYERMINYAWADRYFFVKPWLTMEDLHTFPQNWRCQMDRYYKHFTFLRYSSNPSDKLLGDLVAIMRTQKVPQQSISFITEQLTSGTTAHSTGNTAIRIYLEHRIRSSPYLVELIVKMFYWDYKLLHYTI